MKVLLRDVADVRISNVDKKSFETEIPIILCNFTDVYYNWSLTATKCSNFMHATAAATEIDKFKIQDGDVAITKDSETKYDIGIPTYFDGTFNDVVLGYHCALIRPDKSVLCGSYLNALLNTDYAKRYFAYNASGSGQRFSLSLDSIQSFKFDLPPIDIQLRITNILGSIDKKIEINKKKIAKLETIAQDIYNYWFVQYEFPDENGKPYKSNGGVLVWNNELKRKIPRGWSVSKLKDCISKISTGLNPRDNFILNDNQDNRYVTVKNLTLQGTINFTDCDYISNNAKALIHRRSDIRTGDILFASIAPLGRAYYLTENPKDWDINESVFSLRTNTKIVPPCFLYLYLRNPATIAKMERSSFGSIFKGIRISVINDIQIALPQKSVLSKFESILEPILNQHNFLDSQLQLLQKIKSELLPLLMNGQVKVI